MDLCDLCHVFDQRIRNRDIAVYDGSFLGDKDIIEDYHGFIRRRIEMVFPDEGVRRRLLYETFTEKAGITMEIPALTHYISEVFRAYKK